MTSHPCFKHCQLMISELYILKLFIQSLDNILPVLNLVVNLTFHTSAHTYAVILCFTNCKAEMALYFMVMIIKLNTRF